ncbi:MAG: alpha-galactosidase, partial [Clostridia bacterium]|nr:alpha-galactosidase [Clostridia bacterium]
ILVKEALDYYKTIRQDIKVSLPFWPLGTSRFTDNWVSLGLKTAHKSYIVVWRRNAPDGRCVLPVDHLKGNHDVKVRCAYPADHNTNCAWNAEKGTLTVELPAPVCARIFELEY